MVALALCGGATAWAIASFGALIGGVIVAGLLIAFQIVVAWFFTHPVIPGS